MLEQTLFRHPAYHTESIEITERKDIKELETKLKEKRVLRQNGTLAGEVLFIYDNRHAKEKNSTNIGFGVVNVDTDEPEGIIFVPADMFPYKKTGFSGGNGRKRKLEATLPHGTLQPVGVQI